MGYVTALAISYVVAFAIFFGFPALFPNIDGRSQVIGMLDMLGVMIGTHIVWAIYFYCRKRGWLARPSDWWSRCQFNVSNDWRERGPQGWEVEAFRVWAMRNKTKGTMSICLAVGGLHVHIGVILDRDELDRYVQAQTAAREEHISKMPPQVREMMRQMMQNLPMETSVVRAGVVPIGRPFGDDEDSDDEDDDNNTGGSGVH